MNLSLQRIWGIIYRHLSVYKVNWARMNELIIWPFFELLLWGFISLYVRTISNIGYVVLTLLGALLLWVVFERIQQSISTSFLMELWSRNLLNIFVSPISVTEYMIGLFVVGIMRVGVAGILLWLFTLLLYKVNLLMIGPSLVPLAIALILFGWSLGTIITGIVLRYGQSAESLAWSFAFFLQPFGAVFFPFSVYPEWVQKIIWWIPLPHIFEAMRAVLITKHLPWNQVAWAFGLDAVFLVLAFIFFGAMFEQARSKGYLIKIQD